MITLTVEDTDDLERILEALETQACHHEMEAAWASANICRMLAQELYAQSPVQEVVDQLAQPLIEYEIQTNDGEFLQNVDAKSPENAYDIYARENFADGNCDYSVDIVEISTGIVVEF
ncbi:MAG: hypothetical protein AAGF93_00495 [Cyanobacteria bacterium P01_H01_bin.105]